MFHPPHKIKHHFTHGHTVPPQQHISSGYIYIKHKYYMASSGKLVALHIQTGRYENIAFNTRICHLCDCGNVKDEMHILIFLHCFKS